MARVAHRPEAVVKAYIAGSNRTNTLQSLFDATTTEAGDEELKPPYDPAALIRLWEHSGVLRPYVDAFVTNVDSFGHRLEAPFDLETAEADDRIRDALWSTRLASDGAQEPADAEVQARKAAIQRRARLERNRLEAFFASCCPDYSYMELRRQTRQDLEITGNAYWEVLRDARGEVARLNRVPPSEVRLTKLDSDAQAVREWTPVSAIESRYIEQRRFFRRFTQTTEGRKTYFKEYGDSRVVSMRTGNFYATEEAFLAVAASDDRVATEILHFAIPHPGSPYGVPRWVGNLPTVLGLRELDEVNYAYFENKTVPPLALLVAGGRLGKSVVPKIEEYIEDRIKGRANFHRILIIEAEGQRVTAGAAPATTPTVKFVPLREAQQTDAVFMGYEDKGTEKVGASFRVPRIVVGRDRAINRATAVASLRFCEDQVFQPERERFDAILNRRIVRALGVHFWTVRSNAPIARDPEVLVSMVATLAKVGVLTPREGRELAGDIFNRRFAEIRERWTTLPLALSIAGTRDAGLAALLGGLTDPVPECPYDEDPVVDPSNLAASPADRPSTAARRNGARGLRALGEDDDAATR